LEIFLSILASLIIGTSALVLFYDRKHKRLLKRYSSFSGKHIDEYASLSFSYASAEDKNLRLLRTKYYLDEVAGQGSQSEKIINLMMWVHQLTTHAVNPTVPEELNALNLIHLCNTENKKLNCYMYSIILNQVYLSMGYPSRMVHLLPHSGEHKESHWVIAVYSSDLGKWIMMDPDMCAYLRDQKGVLLGIPEIRRCIVSDQPMVVNEDIGGFSRIFGKWSYTWYLSKNIFRCSCRQNSTLDQGSQRGEIVSYELLPDGFMDELLTAPIVTPRGSKTVYINDESIFWQIP
jgi:hypothetical protein